MRSSASHKAMIILGLNGLLGGCVCRSFSAPIEEPRKAASCDTVRFVVTPVDCGRVPPVVVEVLGDWELSFEGPIVERASCGPVGAVSVRWALDQNRSLRFRLRSVDHCRIESVENASCFDPARDIFDLQDASMPVRITARPWEDFCLGQCVDSASGEPLSEPVELGYVHRGSSIPYRRDVLETFEGGWWSVHRSGTSGDADLIVSVSGYESVRLPLAGLSNWLEVRMKREE